MVSTERFLLKLYRKFCCIGTKAELQSVLNWPTLNKPKEVLTRVTFADRFRCEKEVRIRVMMISFVHLKNLDNQRINVNFSQGKDSKRILLSTTSMTYNDRIRSRARSVSM